MACNAYQIKTVNYNYQTEMHISRIYRYKNSKQPTLKHVMSLN